MIPLNQHRAYITSRIIASFSDDKSPENGFAAWFPSVTTSDRYVSIEVERNKQLVAVDVQRHTGGNINTFSHFTEKIYEPPFFDERYDFTSTQYYDVTFGNRNNPTKSQAFSMIEKSKKRLLTLKNKIMRATEKMRSQVLSSGIVTLKNGDNINFNRKASSMPVLSGSDLWSDGSSNPLETLRTGATFLREEGLTAGSSIDLLIGRDAFPLFINHPIIKDHLDNRRISRGDLQRPQLNNKTGLAIHGTITVYDFTFNVWTYNGWYEDENGDRQYYLDPKQILLLPDDLEAKTAYAGIPAIKRDKGNAEFAEYISQEEAEYYMSNFIDQTKKAHWFEIASAPLPIPVSVDRIWSAQVLP